MVTKRIYTEGEKAEAVALLGDPSTSFYEARDQLGIPVSTLHRWAGEAGLERPDDQTKAATARAVSRIAAKREALRERLLDQADSLLDRMDEAHSTGKFVAGGEDFGKEIVRSAADAKDCQAYSTAAAILIDKHLLVGGDATSITDHRNTGAAEKARGKLDELAQRRAEKIA